MVSPITKIAGVVSIGLLLSTLWFYAQVQKEKASNEILESNVATLTTAVEEKQLTIDTLVSQQQQLNDSIKFLASSNDVANTNLSKATAELNGLRVKEAERAYKDPFTAGSIAADMFYDRLQSISTKNTDRSKDNK